MLSTQESLEPISNVIVERVQYPPKQSGLTVPTAEGIEIDEWEEQLKIGAGPIHESLEPNSNVIAENERHSVKQQWAILMTEEGTRIDESDAMFKNPRSVRHESINPDSKLTLEIGRGKQRLPDTLRYDSQNRLSPTYTENPQRHLQLPLHINRISRASSPLK
jgi:hypothetical protein